MRPQSRTARNLKANPMTTTTKPRTASRKAPATLTAEAIASLIPMSATAAAEALNATATLEERERAAYQRGDHATAAVLGELIELTAKLDAIDEADKKHAETAKNFEEAITAYQNALSVIGCDDVAPALLESVIQSRVDECAAEIAGTKPPTDLTPVLQSVVATLSCALREPGKIGKRSLTALADFLDRFGIDDNPGLSAEAARDAVYSALGGLKPANLDDDEAATVPA